MTNIFLFILQCYRLVAAEMRTYHYDRDSPVRDRCFRIGELYVFVRVVLLCDSFFSCLILCY